MHGLMRGSRRKSVLYATVITTDSNCVDVNYTIHARDVESGEVQMLEEPHTKRHFFLPVIDLMAQITDFERVGAEGFLAGNPQVQRPGVFASFYKRSEGPSKA
jgi:hypothetical protein